MEVDADKRSPMLIILNRGGRETEERECVGGCVGMSWILISFPGISRSLYLCLFLYFSVTPPIPIFLYVSFCFSFSIAVAPAYSCGLHSLWLIHKHWLNLLTRSHFPLPTRPLRKATAKTTSHLAPYTAISIHHSECKRGLGITWRKH